MLSSLLLLPAPFCLWTLALTCDDSWAEPRRSCGKGDGSVPAPPPAPSGMAPCPTDACLQHCPTQLWASPPGRGMEGSSMGQGPRGLPCCHPPVSPSKRGSWSSWVTVTSSHPPVTPGLGTQPQGTQAASIPSTVLSQGRSLGCDCGKLSCQESCSWESV